MGKKPISFTAEMVKAKAEDRKTQTRRVIMPPAPWVSSDEGLDIQIALGHIKAPYQVGDLLWVREGYEIKQWVGTDILYVSGNYSAGGNFGVNLTEKEAEKWRARKFPYRKTPGRFMYKSLARHWLKVLSVRVERLQDISADDCFAEGCTLENQPGIRYSYQEIKPAFEELWDSINAKRGHPWESNPWVWVYEFEKVER